MLMRNFIFRSSSRHYLPTRTPHFILWRHLAARHYQKFRNRLFNRNTNLNQANPRETENCYSYYYHQQPSPSGTTGKATTTPNSSDENPHISIDINEKNDITDISILKNCAINNDSAISEQNYKNNNDDSAKLNSETSNQNVKSNSKAQQVPSRTLVVLRIVLATVGIGLAIAAVILLWYFMGWIYGLPALFIALVAILLTKPGWRWFYIAGATAKRDFTWVEENNYYKKKK